ncbi:MAG: ABC transporter ATP-binding protein [Candidatus Carbobacillus altaicus]|nr:ABC transporter ATP-binding protein [Candidatus Carbobacillus altaicus]
MGAVLSAQDLTKRVKARSLVEGVSLTVREGEIVGLLGPNGAGKTTTMRMLLGLMYPSRGQVEIAGESLYRKGLLGIRVYPKALNGVGALIETPAVYPFLSGLDNLRHFARMRGVKRDEDLLALAREVALEERIADPVRTYSLGMRQRLALAIALLGGPKLLILDEPMNGLDPQGMRELKDTIRHLAKERGLGILFSSHLLADVEALSDRVAFMLGGCLRREVSMAELKDMQNIHYVLSVSDMERASSLLQTFLEHGRIERLWIEAQFLHLYIKAERETVAADVVQTLVEAGVQLYEMRREWLRLEDLFQRWTEEGTA